MLDLSSMRYFRIFMILGSVLGFLAVALGAFGAHGLKNILDAYSLQIFHTAVQYQFWHAPVLLLIGILCRSENNPFLLRAAGLAMFLGVFFFSGSLYLLASTQKKFFGIITPFGGTFFLIGWVCLIIYAIKIPKDSQGKSDNSLEQGVVE